MVEMKQSELIKNIGLTGEKEAACITAFDDLSGSLMPEILVTSAEGDVEKGGMEIGLIPEECEADDIAKTAIPIQLRNNNSDNTNEGEETFAGNKVEIGMQFGDLTVIGEDGRAKNGCIKWACKCSCGKMVTRTVNALYRKEYPSRSCGCKRKSKLVDLTGQTYGYLHVISRAENDKKGKAQWLCECENCGNQVVVLSSVLRRKKHPKTHCGCMTKELYSKANRKHGMRNHPAYKVWTGMKDRCTNPNCPAWKDYGGRGITVCDRWLHSFESFWEDMGPTWQKGLQLDRKDNDSGYCPENCRWVSPKINSNNKRNNVRVNGLTISEFSEKTGINKGTISRRIRHGWPEEELARVPDHRNLLTENGIGSKDTYGEISTAIGKKYVSELSKLSGIDQTTIKKRLKSGMPAELSIVQNPNPTAHKIPYNILRKLVGNIDLDDDQQSAAWVDGQAGEEAMRWIIAAELQAYSFHVWGVRPAEIIVDTVP